MNVLNHEIVYNEVTYYQQLLRNTNCILIDNLLDIVCMYLSESYFGIVRKRQGYIIIPMYHQWTVNPRDFQLNVCGGVTYWRGNVWCDECTNNNKIKLRGDTIIGWDYYGVGCDKLTITFKLIEEEVLNALDQAKCKK